MAFNVIFGWLIKKRMHQIELFRKHPIEVQCEWLERLIENGRETAYGKKYQLTTVSTYNEFKSNLPLQDYNSLKPWIKRVIDGESDVLWPLETKWFAKSSGTTSDRSKLIPVTKDALENCHYKGGKDLLAIYYSNFQESKIYTGKHLVVGGSAVQNKMRPDSYTGDLSSIILKNLPWWVEIKRVPSRKVALMGKWEEKIEKLALETMDEDVTSVSGVPSWTLVLLNRILEIKGETDIRKVWPNLELFMHGGVNFSPYVNEFNSIIPHDDMHYIESYNASEGFFGIQDVPDGDLLLMLDYGVYYEFIPMEHFEGVNSKVVINLNDVEIGKNYALVISTNGGLWRYIIGDTICFTANKPFRFIVTGRTTHFINVFGEELMVHNTDQAVKTACEETNSLIRDYTVAPIFMKESEAGGHEWLIEFKKKPDDLNLFIDVLDQRLQELNSDYAAKRTNDLTLRLPVINTAPKGVFEKWLKNKNKLGGQHKVPRLSNQRKIIEEIYQLMKENSTFN